MRNVRNIILLCVVLLAGAVASAALDWRQAQRATATEAVHVAERLVSLLSLYPFSDTDAGTHGLLAKSLVEQSGAGVAYLLVEHADGRPILTLGDLGLRVSADSQPGQRRFSAPDGAGDILEFSRAFVRAEQGGSILLGMRVMEPPLFTYARASFVATVLFLMLAALIVGYYAIVLSVRRESLGAEAPLGAAGGRPDDNILAAMERMSGELSIAREELRRTAEQSADLSSRLGVVAFESNQAYRVLDNLDAGILMLDPQGRIRRVNRRMLDLLGGERSNFEGRLCGEALQHADLLRVADEHHEGLAVATSAIVTQFPETAPERYFELSCRPLVDATGDRIGALITAQDITRLKRAHKAQEEFLAEASHELLTPLTSIKSYAELLATGKFDQEETRKEFYNTINTETDRLTDLVRNLLNVSRLEAGHLDVERSLVKTEWLIEQCLPAVEAAADEKSITIGKRLPDVFPTILGDKELLKVVLVNILGNAVKYTPEEGTIGLSLFEQGGHIFIEVTDSGCGIPEDEVPHVFDRFYRGRSASVRDQVGSGLGLATALQVVTLHGGAIDVHSEPGKGSCFTIRIPAEDYSLEKR